MLNSIFVAFLVILLLAFIFEFINGFHDSANAIATSISTRVLRPRTAILMAAVLNFVGACISTNVAETITNGLIKGSVPLVVIFSALLAAIIWGLFTWWRGIPSSSSHALLSALIGAYICFTLSTDNIIWGGVLEKIIIPLITSPIIGFVVGYIVMSALFEVLRPLSQMLVNKYFSKLQIFSAALMAFSHGSNDAQKTMGIITMALLSASAMQPGAIPSAMLPSSSGGVPMWVIISCSTMMALGTSIGGWKIIKTMGVNMIKLKPIGGFAAETSASIVIQIATFLGMPVSTTHVISSSIMGVGAAKRFSEVRWPLVKSIGVTWVTTIPINFLLGCVISLIMKAIFF